MSPLPASGPLPPFQGPLSRPVIRPNGDRVTFLAEDVRLVETHRAGFYVEADDLPEPLPIASEEIVAAAAQVANLVAARLHDWRRAVKVLDDAILLADEEAREAPIADASIEGRGEG